MYCYDFVNTEQLVLNYVLRVVPEVIFFNIILCSLTLPANQPMHE